MTSNVGVAVGRHAASRLRHSLASRQPIGHADEIVHRDSQGV
jgi:hypothetical protein